MQGVEGVEGVKGGLARPRGVGLDGLTLLKGVDCLETPPLRMSMEVSLSTFGRFWGGKVS